MRHLPDHYLPYRPGHCAARSVQAGYLMLPVMITIVIIASIALLVSREGNLHGHLVQGEVQGVRAGYLAEAGLQRAVWQVENNECQGDISISPTAMGADSYSATATTGGSSTAYSLSADQDAWFRSDDTTANNGTNVDHHLRMEGGNLEYGVTRFDLSTLPADAQINSATAWFYIEATKGHPEGPVTVHQTTSDWTETGATWDTMSTNFDKVVLGMIPPQPAAGDAWVQVNLTAQVQAWMNGAPNNGVMLIPKGEGIHAEYVSREGPSNQQPRLDVVVGTGPATPAAVQATGTLANGVTRTLTRPVVQAYQPASHSILQPGADGKDAWVTEDKANWNYGAATYLRVRAGGGGHWHSFLEFDLERLPRGVHILSAQLELYRRATGQDNPGSIDAYPVTQSWEEGSSSGGTNPGVTFDFRDTALPWTNPGGDYAAMPVSSFEVDAVSNIWYSLEVTPFVSQWLDGKPNYGLVLVAGDDNVWAEFASSEDADPALHPKLTITYACQCGTACMSPQGSGNILMVVINPTTLVPEDQQAKDLFESWGYTVKPISESANQSAFNAEFGAQDVVFISETVNSNQLGSKLVSAPIGVVTQDGDYNDDLGFAAGKALPVGRQVNIVDNSHYITLPFVNGPLDIYSANMEGLTVSGLEAAGLQTLADWGSAGSLVVLDRGALMENGGNAAGRRVMLPLGTRYNFNWNYLNANGRLLVQRALAWGMDADATSIGNVLLVVTNPANPTAQETAKKALMESWNFNVNLIDDIASQTDFDTAIAANDVAYIPQDITSSNLGTKLVNAPIGVVNEEGEQVDELGFANGVLFKSNHEINVIDNTHYITETFATGLLTFVTSDQSVHLMDGGAAPGLQVLAETFNVGSQYKKSMGTLDPGDELSGGGSAAGRRVELPWGGGTFDINALNDDGRTIMKRSIEWAATVSPKTPLLMVVADATALTTEEDVTKTLVESWNYAVVLIDDDATQANFDTAASTVDVAFISSGVNASALGTKLTDATIGVVVEEHQSWDDLELCSDRSGSGSTDMDITNNSHYITSPFSTGALTILTAAADIMHCIATLSAGAVPLIIHNGNPGLLTLDTGALGLNGQPSNGRRVTTPWGGNWDPSRMNNDGQTILRRSIEWAAGADGGVTSPPGYLDEFNNRDCMAADYAGSDGSLDWTGSMWTEAGESNGSCAGLVQVAVDPSVPDAGSYRLMLDEANRQAVRTVDLSSLSSATLSFEYRRDNYPTINDSFAVLVSRDGSTWAELGEFSGIANDPAYLTASYDISAFIEPTTHIAFATKGSNTVQTVYIDNVRITESGGGSGVVFEEFTEAADSSATSLDIARPPGTGTGDLLIATLATDGSTVGSMSPPVGWTVIDLTVQSGAVTYGVWWKLAGASEPANYTFSWSGNEAAYGTVMRFAGHDPANPIDVFTNSGGSSSTPTSPAVTTTVPNAMILRLGGFDDDDIDQDVTGLTDHTVITMDDTGNGASTTSSGAGYVIQAAVGSSGTSNFALTGSEQYRAVTVAIAPAP